MIKPNDNKLKRLSYYNIPKIFLILVIVWFAITFIILPTITIITSSFYDGSAFSFNAFKKVLNSKRAMLAIKHSLITGVVLMFTTTIVGITQVLLTEYFDLKFSKIFRIAYMIPLVFTGVILNNGYLYVYGKNGILTGLLLKIFPNLNLNWFTGAFAVLFVMTFGCTHQYMIFFRNAINSIDNELIDSAKNLGSSQFQILFKVVMPIVKPTLITLIIITFQTGLISFAAPLMVGGKSFQTISPLILTFANRPNSRDIAAVLSLVLSVFQILLLAFMTWNESKGNYMSVSNSNKKLKKQKIHNPVAKVIIYLVAIILLIIQALPAVMVIISSFLDTQALSRNIISIEHFTLQNYKNVLVDSSNLDPLLRSFLFSGIAAVGSVLLMLLLVRLVMKSKSNKIIKSLEYFYYIPWLVPSILIALGYMMVYDRPRFLLFNQSVIGSQWILVIAYAVTVIPSTLRYLKSAYYNFNTNLEEASQNLGASSLRTFFHIVLPAVLPTALALCALNFNSNLAEYNMSAFLYPPGSETIGIIITQNSSSVATIDSKAVNMVYSVLLMLINSLVIYFVYGRGLKFSNKQSGFLEKNSRY
ncbi:ABC transporter permease [Finegoldia magna]|uniref:ABC transporter permease n=1 Tax=Finegoldia magna TaxID=1260 RepID=UPI000D719A8F|nr:iron ABC transporter permease [Finegoldia magna]MCC3310244.1 iron ABC transporter permease [Finegoldia magna]PWV49894.1 iron(III) transport system permease protein [Finegoldia magna]